MNDLLSQAIALAPKVKAISDEVVLRHVQRHDVIKATWLAVVSGHPAFFLGTPGMDKTGTIKAMLRSIAGAKFREELMPMLATGAQLVVEATSLREKTEADGSKLLTTVDKLGGAASLDIFFADEVWKTEDQVLKVLFDLFNLDDVRYDGQVAKNNLLTFLAASNEIPDAESKVSALWSRMTIRVPVRSLDRTGKLALVEARLKRDRNPKTAELKQPLTLDEVKALNAARPFVDVPLDVREAVLEILQELLEDKSVDFQWAWDDDRRFGRLFDVMQANALLDGRTAVGKQDLTVLEWMLWDTPEQIAVVKAKLTPYTRTPLTEAQELVDALQAPDGHVKKVTEQFERKLGVQAIDQCDTALKELERLENEAGDPTMRAAISQFKSEVNAIKRDVIAVVTGQKKPSPK